MTKTIAIAPVRKSIVVETTPQRAFEIFTAGIDRWWPKSHGIGATPIRESIIEPFVGGRWYTKHEDGADLVVGRVKTWQPGQRLVVSWQIDGAWKPEPRPELASEVEVTFTAEAAGTRVDLEHRAFERMAPGGGDKMRGAVDSGWPGLLGMFARATSDGGARS